jgi:hypothetical protein
MLVLYHNITRRHNTEEFDLNSVLIHFTPSQHISLRPSVIVPSHVTLGFQSVVILQHFQAKIVYQFLVSSMRATRPYVTLLDKTHIYQMKLRNYGDRSYIVFCNPLLLCGQIEHQNLS